MKGLHPVVVVAWTW